MDLIGNIVSESYIHTTIAMLKEFGARVHYDEFTKIAIVKSLGYSYNDPEYVIEGDMSTAAFDIAYSAIFGHPMVLKKINSDSLQGETELLEVLRKHFEGFECDYDEDTTIKGVELGKTYEINTEEIFIPDANDCFIALSTILALKLPKGTCVKITGIGNQRIKECNRIESCVQILNSFHVLAYELDDGLAIISNPSILKMKDKVIKVPTFNDHRIAMAFAILGSAVCANNKIVIQNGKTVDKTFPEFWKHIHTNYGITYSGNVFSRAEN